MPARRGHTLLELVLATSLTAIALVPTLALIRDAMTLSRTVETRNHLTTLCASKLEEHLAIASAGWAEGTFDGDFAADGFSDLRYRVVRSDESASGGIPDRLMVVSATVWQDGNADTAIGSDELRIDYYSKIAKLTTYQESFGGP